MSIVADPFVVARCDVHARLGLDLQMEPWDLDRVLMAISGSVLRRIFPAMIAVEAKIAAAPPAEEWQLVAELFEVCPVGLRVEPAAGIEGCELYVEAGHVSRHDQMMLLDALDEVLATMVDDTATVWPSSPLCLAPEGIAN